MNPIHNIYAGQLVRQIAPTGVRLSARRKLEIHLEVLEGMLAQGIERVRAEVDEVRKALAIAAAEEERLARSAAVRAGRLAEQTMDELLAETRREFIDRARNLAQRIKDADLGESPWETRRSVGV